jgi:hypothetical protein
MLRKEAFMRSGVIALVLVLAICGTAAAGDGFAGRPIINNAFAPTGYTLHRGEFTIGLGTIAFGVTDKAQIGTNLLLWAFQYYNADVKVSFAKTDDYAFGAGVGIGRLSLDFGDDDDEVDFTAVSPYAAASMRIGKNTLAHISGQYAHFDAEGNEEIEDADASGAAQGTSFFVGLEHSYSNRTKFVTDIGYDTTFEGMRVSGAVLFGWTKFRLKLGISYFDAGDGFTFPLIGLWWRFQG